MEGLRGAYTLSLWKIYAVESLKKNGVPYIPVKNWLFHRDLYLMVYEIIPT